MTRFAVGGKWGRPGRPPFAAASGRVPAAKASGVSRDASAAVPMPVLASPKKWRRVIASFNSLSGVIVRLLLRNRFVEVQNCARHGGPGGQFRRLEARIGFRFADREQLLRALGVGLVFGNFFGFQGTQQA